MRATSALKEIAEITASQWGFVTTAQAEKRQVSKLEMSRLAKSGLIERVTHGVYRDAGAPSSEFDEVRAHWLAARPFDLAEDRIAAPEHDFVASGATAAWLQGLGDIAPNRIEFVAETRKQTAYKFVQFRMAKMSRDDITLAQGLPVQTPAAAVLELIRQRTDLTLVAQIMSDAQGRITDMANFSERINAISKDYAFPRDGGQGLVDLLNRLSTPAYSEPIAAISEIAKRSFELNETMKKALGPSIDIKMSSEFEDLKKRIAQAQVALRNLTNQNSSAEN